MGDNSQKVERARVFRIGVADEPVEALSVGETAGAMLCHRSGERLFRMAAGIHGDIPNAKCWSDVNRKTDNARGQGLSHRGFRRPRPADRRAARASTGTPYYMQCLRRDA